MGAARDFNKVNHHGLTPFLRAVESGRFTKVAEMLAGGADVNSRSGTRSMWSHLTRDIPYPSGTTALHIACMHGHTAIVTLLLNRGADAAALDDDKCTPMDYALHSLSYYEDRFEKKKGPGRHLGDGAKKAQARIHDYEQIIATLLTLGGKPALYSLPKKFSPPRP